MNNIDNLINKRREDIIQEGMIAKAITSFFKGIVIGIAAPYIIIIALLIIIAPIVKISNKINKEKLEKVLKNNPEFIKNLNKIAQNIANGFIKTVDSGNKNYFEFLPITSNENLLVISRANKSIEIGSQFIKLNAPIIFKDITGCNNYNEYCNKVGHKNADDEPECIELKEFFKKVELAIQTFNSELQNKYKGLRIALNDDIDYDYLFTSLGIFESAENYPCINIMIKCNVDTTTLDEDFKKEISKTIITLKPIVEKRINK